MYLLKRAFLGLSILGLGLFTFSSCESESLEANLNEGEYTATEEAVAFAELGEKSLMGPRHRPMFKGLFCDDLNEKLADCATVKKSGTTYPKTIVITLKDECKGQRKKLKNGKITIRITKPMKEKGAVKTIEFMNESEDGKEIKRTRRIENLGLNKAGNYHFSQTSDFNFDGKRGAFSRKSKGIIEVLSDFSADECDDHKLSITGSSSGNGPKGERSRTILKPIIKDPNCKHPVAGIVQIEGPRGTSTIDFGEGDCDSKATITNDEGEKIIDLDKIRLHRHPLRKSRR